jgi:hypothetical protein
MGGRSDGKIVAWGMVSGARIYPFPTLGDMIMTVGDLTSECYVACVCPFANFGSESFDFDRTKTVEMALRVAIRWLLSNLLILRETFNKCKWDISVSCDSFDRETISLISRVGRYFIYLVRVHMRHNECFATRATTLKKSSSIWVICESNLLIFRKEINRWMPLKSLVKRTNV